MVSAVRFVERIMPLRVRPVRMWISQLLLGAGFRFYLFHFWKIEQKFSNYSYLYFDRGTKWIGTLSKGGDRSSSLETVLRPDRGLRKAPERWASPFSLLQPSKALYLFRSGVEEESGYECSFYPFSDGLIDAVDGLNSGFHLLTVI